MAKETVEPLERDVPSPPDDVNSEEESPYLRRQKSVSVRRSRFSRRARWTLFTVAVLLPVGVAGYLLATFGMNSPIFALGSPDNIVVEGNRYVSREEVLGALGLPLTGSRHPGTNIFRISLDTRRRLVETLPWVRTASVTRIFPQGLLVHITERTPVAFATVGGHVSLVDDEGTMLEKPENGAFDFPVINGLESLSSVEERHTRMALYEEFIRQLGEEAPRMGWAISEVDLVDSEDLKALLIRGQETIQVHFGRQNFLERFRSFLTLLPELEKANPKLDSVDLQYRNQIVVNSQPAATAPEAKQLPPPLAERKD